MDVGFAYDGDADRCIAVDEFGRVVNGDLILYLCGLEMKQKGELLNNTIVTTVMSNFGLYKSLDKVEGSKPLALPLTVGAVSVGDGAVRPGVGDSESCWPLVLEFLAMEDVLFAKLADCWHTRLG